MNFQQKGNFFMGAIAIEPDSITDDKIRVPMNMYDQCVNKLQSKSIEALIINKSFENVQQPVLVKLVRNEDKLNQNTLFINRYLYSFLLGTVQLDTDIFRIGLVSNIDDDFRKAYDINSIKSNLSAIKEISNKKHVQGTSYYDAWKLQKTLIKPHGNINFEPENDKDYKFFSGLKNFYSSGLKCPHCESILYKTIFNQNKEYRIETDDLKHPIIGIKRVFSCVQCATFYTAAKESVADGFVYSKECIDFTDYKETLITMNEESTSEGRMDGGFVDLDY